MSTLAGRRAILLGSTGAVGGHVLAELVRNPAFAAVTTLGRRPADVADPPAKLAQHVVSVDDPASYRSLLAGHDVAICTLGVGQPSKMARDEVWKIEVDYVMGFASACREEGIEHFSLMTSVGANAKSSVDYLEMKGLLEDRVKALGFRRTSLFQPSMLLTPQNRYGVTQALTLLVWPKIGWALAGGLRRYRGIKVEDLGRAIALDAARAGEGVSTYTWDDFQEILRSAG
ncbi:MAG: NAD(P)H-binding protein [Byssovorax sp.]